LESRCKEAGIEILTRVPFLNDAADAVRSLARQDARIIVGMFYGDSARKVMCEAYKQNLYGKQHVWFLIGWYEDNWYVPVPGINCTEQEMLKVLEGHLTTEAIMLNKDDKITINGQTAHQWLERYHRLLNSDTETGRWHVPSRVEEWTSEDAGDNVTLDSSYTCINHCRYPQGYQEAPLAYDAVWAVALALNATIGKLSEKNIRVESFDYHNK
jgi:gamma-aminobutyric acid type B receptor